jgi:glutathione S-transferase
MQFIDIEDAIRDDGLRLILVAGTPSPWGQAAKAMMEYKGLDFACAAQIPGGANEALVAWAGINSGPVVAWKDEAPINRWDDILFLLERLAPQRPLLPEDRSLRVRALGLSIELCGELGLGWNRRLALFQAPMQAAAPPEAVVNMARKYRYNEADVALADRRTAASLSLFAAELKAQQTRGSDYFVGDELTAVDFYWAAFCNLFDVPPDDIVPMAPGFRPMFEQMTPTVKAALDPLLIAHRDRIMQAYFKIPMES